MGIDNLGQATLIQELNELDIALDQLRQQFEHEDQAAILALQRLYADGQDLDRLGEMLNRRKGEVDLFDALRLDGSEEFHSNFLAWLLDPTGSHGLGGQFLQGFLAISGAWRAIRSAALPNTTIRREKHLALDGGRGRLDIRILNESSHFLCAVENKVWARESGDQLAWYRQVLETEYPDRRVHLVFLTRRGEDPDDPGERGHWKQLSYTAILRLVEQTIEAAKGTANEDVLAFLRQYATTLRRNIVPEVSNDVHALARRIYRKHKQAIDLIIEHRERYEPNYVNEGFGMIREAIREQPLWRQGTINHPYVRFVSADWVEFSEEFLNLDDWPHSLLQFSVHVTSRGARLTFFLAPSDNDELRQKIFNRVKANQDIFNCSVTEYTDELIGLHTEGQILKETDYARWWDEDGIRDAISSRLNDFAQGSFHDINRIIVECLEEYRSENG